MAKQFCDLELDSVQAEPVIESITNLYNSIESLAMSQPDSFCIPLNEGYVKYPLIQRILWIVMNTPVDKREGLKILNQALSVMSFITYDDQNLFYSRLLEASSLSKRLNKLLTIADLRSQVINPMTNIIYSSSQFLMESVKTGLFSAITSVIATSKFEEYRGMLGLVLAITMSYPTGHTAPISSILKQFVGVMIKYFIECPQSNEADIIDALSILLNIGELLPESGEVMRDNKTVRKYLTEYLKSFDARKVRIGYMLLVVFSSIGSVGVIRGLTHRNSLPKSISMSSCFKHRKLSGRPRTSC